MNNRRKLIAGNWKMNKTSADGVALAQEVVAAVGKQTDVDVVMCPPFTAVESVGRVLEGSNVRLGAQNMHHEASGAFTGEVSAPMLRAIFASYVILGHSERRTRSGTTPSNPGTSTCRTIPRCGRNGDRRWATNECET